MSRWNKFRCTSPNYFQSASDAGSKELRCVALLCSSLILCSFRSLLRHTFVQGLPSDYTSANSGGQRRREQRDGCTMVPF